LAMKVKTKARNLETKLGELEAQLAESAPKSQAEALKERIMEMESELAAAKARVKELESAMTKPTEETQSEVPTE